MNMVASALLVPLFLMAGVSVLVFIFCLWMLADCIKNDRLSSTNKIVWSVLILFTGGLGALIYYFAGRGTT
jgi:hypothetical protein